MSDKTFLFINNSDLADTDSNGRTLRDVFEFVENKNLYSFCIVRKNENLDPKNVFFVDEGMIFKPGVFLKTIHSRPKTTVVDANIERKKKTKKNPLTCLIRNFVWDFAFLFFRKRLKKWVCDINPDYVVFDPSDFIFMHKLAKFVSKVTNKKIILYNTEDYFFKDWNYLHKENGFSFLYPLFRFKLRKAYKKTFSRAKVCFHNVEGLQNLFKLEFPATDHYLIYHPSTIITNHKSFISSTYKDFYYCGGLDKGRDRTFVCLARSIKKISPDSKIYFNGRLNKMFSESFINEIENVVNLGFCSYQEVNKRVQESRILISVASLDDYDAKDKYYVFSTKLSDYVASLNPILHIGPEGEEYNTLKKNNLAFVCNNEKEIDKTVSELFDYLHSSSDSMFQSQLAFYNNNLNPIRTKERIKQIIEKE